MVEGKKRYAVLVGCNYPDMDDYLDGAVTDVLKMREVLVSRFGFERANIVLLVDIDLPGSYVTAMDVLDSSVSDVGVPAAGSSSLKSTDVFSVDLDSPVTPTNLAVPGPPMKPTGTNIKLKLREMICHAEPGDVLFFQFSGHGVQIPCENGTKTAITPCDFNLITDEHFRQLVNRLPEGASFTFLSDSCTTGGDLIDKSKEQAGDPSVVISSTAQLPNAANHGIPMIPYTTTVFSHLAFKSGDPSVVISSSTAQLPNAANHRIRMIPYDTVFNHLASKSNIDSLNINDHLSAIFGNETRRLGLPTSDPLKNPLLPLVSGILLTGSQANEPLESDPFENPLPLQTGILLTGCQADSVSVDVQIDPLVDRLEGYGAFSNAVQKVFREYPNRISNKELIRLTRVELGGMQYPCLYCSDENVDAPFLWQPEH